MSKTYETAWFLVDEKNRSGPPSLFLRVEQVMSAPRLLGISPKRLDKIAKTYPMTPDEKEEILRFYPDEWSLYAAKTRLDTGKFILSTWTRWLGKKCFYVDIRYGDGIERMSWARNDSMPDDWMYCDNYDKYAVAVVEKANAALLAENAPFPPPARPLPPRETEMTHA